MLFLSEKCLRGRKDCQPYSQIASANNESFFCCGKNDGTTRSFDQDKYTVCFKNESIDEISHNDKRDLVHHASVLIQALAIIEEDE